MIPLDLPERLEAPNFVIRSFQPGDGARMQAAVSASYQHLRPWLSWPSATVTIEESERKARRCRASYMLQEDFTLGIFSADERELLGGTGFHLREGPVDSQSAEIGMWIAGGHAGRGLGTAVLTALLGWGFSDWPWLRLAWHCDTNNHASRRVAEKAGMRLEGILRGQKAAVGPGRRDTACYGLLRDDPR
jgi:RimJ/RimL family protein N-acetyltransferase